MDALAQRWGQLPSTILAEPAALIGTILRATRDAEVGEEGPIAPVPVVDPEMQQILERATILGE